MCAEVFNKCGGGGNSFSKPLKSTKVIPPDKILSGKQKELYNKVINNTKCFDRRDNTFLLSNRGIADTLRVSASSIDQVFRVLNKWGLIKKVKTTTYTFNKNKLEDSKPLRMVSPRYTWISYSKVDRFIMVALFDLGCLLKVKEWRKYCGDNQVIIDTDTGEEKDFNWYYIEEYSSRYTIWDRCYRKGVEGVKNYTRDSGNSNQHYCLNEADTGQLTEEDKEWFCKVNRGSVNKYKGIDYHHKPLFNNMSKVEV